MHNKNLFLIVDMQNDFCDPAGSLYIPGGEKDVQRVAGIIRAQMTNIDKITVTMDLHQVIDISHPYFWQDKDGNPPPPFTQINPDDVKSDVWIPKFESDRVKAYIDNLDRQGEFPHVVWPEHCLIGSWGAALHPDVMQALINWSRSGKTYGVVQKGTHPFTEHFGAFRANIPIEGESETALNVKLLEEMNNYDHIIIAGEAKSHCVANTLKQMIDFSHLLSKTTVLEDCMSNVKGFETIADPIFKKISELGANIINSNDLILE